MKNTYGELSTLKKENEELSGRVDTANQRYAKNIVLCLRAVHQYTTSCSNRLEDSQRQYRASAAANVDLTTTNRSLVQQITSLERKASALQDKQESVQQYRHETNRTLGRLEGAYAECSALEKVNEELRSALQSAERRYYVTVG